MIGRIEVITGCMFSGKTEELIKRVTQAKEEENKSVIVFKPIQDTRYLEDIVRSHSQLELPCVTVDLADEIFDELNGEEVIGIDEGQFFDPEIIGICSLLSRRGHRVIIAGLDLDSKGKPFGPIPELMAIAEEVVKKAAICTVCGAPAYRTQRTSTEEERIVIGAEDKYEPRCLEHWTRR